MRCVVFSDLHLANWKEFSSIDPVSNFNTRLIDCSLVLGQIFDYCTKNKIKRVIFGGDFFHNKMVNINKVDYTEITPDVNYVAYYWFSVFSKEEIAICAIPGQHDYYRGKFHALYPYVNLINIFAYSGGIIWLDDDVIIHPCFNQSTVEKQKDELKKVAPVTSKRNIFLGHFLVKDLLEKGLYNLDLPCITYKDLPKGFDLYLLGDYHPHVYIPEKKLISIGSTHQHTFGSVKRGLGGFLDLDLDTLEFKRIELKAPRFIDVQNYKKEDFNDYDFYRIHVKDENEVKKFERKIKKVKVKYRLVYDKDNDKMELSKEEKEEYLVTMDPEGVMIKYLEKSGKPVQWVEKGKEYL